MSNLNKIESVLTAYQKSSWSDKYVIKYKKEVVFFGGVNIFKTQGMAKRAILNHAYGKNTVISKSPSSIKLLEDLIENGTIEIMKL